MRFVLDITIPPEKFNAAVREGTAATTMARILEDAEPEAAFFTSKGGHRGGYVVVDLEDASEIPRYAEPWFLHFDARVEFHPVMTPEDLARAGLEGLGEQWG